MKHIERRTLTAEQLKMFQRLVKPDMRLKGKGDITLKFPAAVSVLMVVEAGCASCGIWHVGPVEEHNSLYIPAGVILGMLTFEEGTSVSYIHGEERIRTIFAEVQPN